MKKIRIVIADDHKLFRETLGEIINGHADFQVVAQCCDTIDAIEMTRQMAPDIVLMDVNIPPLSGIEATKMIVSFSAARVIGLTMHATSAYVMKMIQSGAMGYLTKDSTIEEVFTAIAEVYNGKRYLCSQIKTELADAALQNSLQLKSGVRVLTDRELQIVDMIKEGLSSVRMANMLNISPNTIESHRHNILRKLNLKNSSQLVNFVNSNVY